MARSELEKDMVDSVVTAGMLMMVIVMVMPIITQQISASFSKTQVLTTSPGTTAENVGAMWYEITPLGQSNQLKMIGENSTGAFEEILISLST